MDGLTGRQQCHVGDEDGHDNSDHPHPAPGHNPPAFREIKGKVHKKSVGLSFDGLSQRPQDDDDGGGGV